MSRCTSCFFSSRLLDERASGLSEGVSDDVDGSLALGFLLGIQVDVRHLLARVEQRVLGALGQDVLVRQIDSSIRLNSTIRSRENGTAGWERGRVNTARVSCKQRAQGRVVCRRDERNRPANRFR